jgi:formylmethanofuran dehydrogenase subunit B
VIAAEPPDVVNPTVFIRTAQPGLQSAGTIFRFDGVPLPLRAIVPSPLPTAEQVLRELIARLRNKNA